MLLARSPVSRLPLLLLVFGIHVQQTQSREWTTEADVSVGALYSDNICLLPENEEGQFVGTFTPSARFNRSGTRSTLDLFASVRMNTLEFDAPGCTPRGNQQTFAPRIRLSNANELVSDKLYLDVEMWANQNAVNAFGPGSTDNINARDNSNTSFRYSVSPYWSQRVGDSSSVLLRYSWDQMFNSRDEVQDSDSNEIFFRLAQDPNLNKFTMGLTASYSEVTFKETPQRREVTNELSSAQVDIAYQVNSNWQLNGYIGQEWNDFLTNAEDTEGNYWDVGMLWTPSVRVSVGVGYGERFFGEAPRFDISYRHRRTTIEAAYSRVLTYQRNLRTSDPILDDADLVLDPGLAPDDTFLGIPTTNTPSPLLNESLRLRYGFKARRTTFNLTGYYSEQTRAEDGLTDIFQRVGFDAQRTFSRNLYAIVGINWFGREPDPRRSELERARDSETWRLNLGLSRQLAGNARLKLDYWHSLRESEFALDEYTENRVELSINYSF